MAPAEGGGEVTVTATLDEPAPEEETTVTLTTGGTAPLDADYTLSSSAITIAKGETAGTIIVTDDAEHDPDETIVLDAERVNPALTAPPLTLTIEYNDVVPVSALPVGGALLLGALLVWRGAQIERRPVLPLRRHPCRRDVPHLGRRWPRWGSMRRWNM